MSAVAPGLAVARGRTRESARAGYIVSPRYDICFFLAPPLVSLALGILISGTSLSEEPIFFGGERTSRAMLFLGVLVQAHLVAVVVRSHVNPSIFRRHRLRFVLVPILLYAAILWSDWALVTATVLVVFWDVYHSGMQTFGFARIYDRNMGNDPNVGRRLDAWLNQLLYAGPIVGGATMLDHFRVFSIYRDLGALRLAAIPRFMEQNQRFFTLGLLVFGALFLLYYVVSYIRLHRRGYQVSPQKVFLLASTGLVSVTSWGLNSFGEAFFIMNLFHALQYLGLVWWAEERSIKRLFRVEGRRQGTLVAASAGLLLVLAYGLWSEAQPADLRWAVGIVQVVSLMHFWYDGFVWSVGKKEI